MRQFTLELDKGSQRPVVTLESWANVAALFDTGAIVPVWTDDESNVRNLTIQNAEGRSYVFCHSAIMN